PPEPMFRRLIPPWRHVCKRRCGKGADQRAHRKPKLATENDGATSARAAKTPANWPSVQCPPRKNAPGRLAEPPPPVPPKQLASKPGTPDALVQSVQVLVARSAQSATHSSTLPTMSNAPQFE